MTDTAGERVWLFVQMSFWTGVLLTLAAGVVAVAWNGIGWFLSGAYEDATEPVTFTILDAAQYLIEGFAMLLVVGAVGRGIYLAFRRRKRD